MTMLSAALTLIAFGLILFASQHPITDKGPASLRVDEIEGMLPDDPEGLGRPIDDREAWQALAGTDAYRSVVLKAEKLQDRPIPEITDDLYLDFSRTGNRTRYQDIARERHGRLAPLVLAECVEDRGRFLLALEELVAAICSERTWVLPAHDRDLSTFEGEFIKIDLTSSALGWRLATANWLLGDRLSDEVREQIQEAVNRQVIDPWLAMLDCEREHQRWMYRTSNWNAVCVAGVTGAGLAQIEDRRRRAEVVAAGEHYSLNFLDGFPEDGYCSEGLGYWNYGFGHYILLSETIYQATGGEVDLMARPGVAAPATFGRRIQIIGEIAPAFSDCGIDARPDPRWMYYLNRRYAFGLDEYDEVPLPATTAELPSAMIFGFSNSASEGATLDGADPGSPERTWFGDSAVLIGRPGPNSETRLGVAMKGGCNAEMHNHNDIGSWVAVVEDHPVLLDPGAEVYTARTFSGERYESDLINSWGHPVPVIGGTLQEPGEEAQATILARDFSDERDTLTIEFSAAYDLPELCSIEREFVYDRTGDGTFTVTDSVELDEPLSFETAVVTYGEWEQPDEDTLIVRDGGRAVEVTVDAGEASWELLPEVIDEDTRAEGQPTRLGLRLAKPVSEATVELTVRPIADDG